jgi:anti-sigma B factor antagonist
VDITVRKIGNVSILDLQGPLRTGEGELKFREQVKSLVQSGEKNLAVNLAAVSMLDSSGIGTLVRTHKLLAESGGKFTLFAPSKKVRQTLKIVGLDRFLEIYEDEASALAS